MTQDPRFYRLRQLLEEQKVSRPPEPPPAPPEKADQPEDPEPDPEVMPETLRGWTPGQMFLAYTDGELSPEEEDWLMSRDLPAEITGTTMPNLKYILSKGKHRRLKV